MQFSVTNIGTMTADEVAEVYAVRQSASRIRHPKKQLFGFERLRELNPDETRTVQMRISCKELAVYDVISTGNVRGGRNMRKALIRCSVMLTVLSLCLSGCRGQGNDVQDSAAGTESGAESLHKETETEVLPMEETEEMEDAPFVGSVVSIVKSDKEEAVQITAEEIEEMVLAVTEDMDTVVHNGQTVVIKPNLVQMKVDSTGDLLDKEVNGVTTDWRVTDAVVKRVRELNPDGKVYIMEGSASGPTSEVMEYYHYTPEYIKGVDDFISLEEDCGAWQDFDAPEVVKVDLPEGLLHQTYYFNRILYEADVLISIPCLKTSSGVVVTAGIKNVSLGTPPGNLYGAAPDNPSKVHMVSHKISDGELDKWIYDYYCAKPINYVIVDGLQGFQSGPVPYSQERKETDKMNMGVIIGGKDAVAVDNICALIVGWDPKSVGYLNHFRENMGLGDLENIRVKGAYVDDLRKYFTIRRPELGGVQISDSQGPEFTAEMKENSDGEIVVSYAADEDAYKLEVFVDGFFCVSDMASAEGSIYLDDRKLAEGSHEILVIAYDRFLNRSAVTLNYTKK